MNLIDIQVIFETQTCLFLHHLLMFSAKCAGIVWSKTKEQNKTNNINKNKRKSLETWNIQYSTALVLNTNVTALSVALKYTHCLNWPLGGGGFTTFKTGASPWSCPHTNITRQPPIHSTRRPSQVSRLHHHRVTTPSRKAWDNIYIHTCIWQDA